MAKRVASAPRPGARVAWAFGAALLALSSSVVYASWVGDPHGAIELAGLANVASPSAPRASHCPEGFPKLSLHDGTATCGAWPAPGARACEEGLVRFPGETTCRSLAECDAFAGALRVPSAVPTLAAALAIARDGDVVELGPGTYGAPDRMEHAVEIRSACGADVHVLGTLEVTSATTLTGISFEGAIIVRAGGRLTLAHTRVSGPNDAIVVDPEGALVGARLVVDAGDHAISVAEHATAELDRAVLAGAVALSARGAGARASLTRVALTGRSDAGIVVAEGARLTGDRIVIDGSAQHGLLATGDATTVELGWAFLRRDASFAIGIEVERGARAIVTTSRVDSGEVRTRATGGGALTLRDSFVASEELGSRSLVVEDGAHVRLERVDVRGARGAGMRVDGAFLEARDLSMLATAAGDAAVEARGGARVEIWRARADRPRSRGFLATDEGTSLVLHDVLVRGAQRSECATAVTGCDGTPGGDALAVLAGAGLRADHVHLERSRGCGVVVAGAWSTLDLAQASIVENRVGICADGAETGALRIGAGVVEVGNESSYARPAPPRVALR